MSEKKVLLIVAHEGYQHLEYGTPKNILAQAGLTVVTASDLPGTATGKDGSTTEVDLTLDKVSVEDYAGIFFIGGPDALEHLDNQTSYDIARAASKKEIPLGAICISTRILAKAGVLNGRQATGWDGDNELEHIYHDHNVRYVKEDVVVDGPLLTAIGPDAAERFGQEAVALLQNTQAWG